MAIAKALVAKAKDGHPIAAGVLFDRLWGRPSQPIELATPNDAPPALDLTRLSKSEIEVLGGLLERATPQNNNTTDHDIGPAGPDAANSLLGPSSDVVSLALPDTTDTI